MEELDKKYRENGFSIPEAYFESLDYRVLERLKDMEPETKPAFSLWRSKTVWLAAAGLALICSIAYILTNTSGTISTDTAFLDQVDPAELAQFESEVELSEDEFEEIIPGYTVDSLYQADILKVSNSSFSQDEIQDLEEEYTALEEEIDI